MKMITAAEIRSQFTETRYFGQAPSLIVTADDIHAIKAAARIVLPGMKPQHRLEAIARALRFGSFAAMKSALNRATPHNPLLLQMSFEERSQILLDGFEEYLHHGPFVADETGLPLQVYSYIALGAVFLSALYSARAGLLDELGEEAMLLVGVEDKISALHRTASLQGLPQPVADALRKKSAVWRMPSRVEIAPIARIKQELRAYSSQLLIDEIDHTVDYDFIFPGYEGEGEHFGKIPLDTAVFVSNQKNRIDVLPHGWSCSWSYDFGANSTAWHRASKAQRLKTIRENTRILVKELGVPSQEVGIAFKMIPELADEPEARSAPNIANPRTIEELLMAGYDGKNILY